MPLIVFEGVDASGKATQAERLYLKLMYEGKKVHRITFPNYKSESSAPARMYLSGEFGESAGDVNPYAASALFAVDRYCSFMKYWKKHLDNGDIIIADRYVTSNFIHQASKIGSDEEKKAYLTYQADFEYNKLGLPKPDMVLFLSVPPEVSISLMEKRENKFTGHMEHDIHERDRDYIRKSFENARSIADMFDFVTVECTEDGNLLPIEDIAERVYDKVSTIL